MPEKVNTPKNLIDAHQSLFQSVVYDVPEFTVSEHRNTRVTQSGICMKNWIVLPASIHGFKDRKRHFYMYAWYQNLLGKHSRLGKEKTYAIIHNHWCPGYFHWVTEALPRLWALKDKLGQLTILLPENFMNFGFVKESLEPFKSDLTLKYITEKKISIIPKLVLPRNKPICHFYNPEVLRELREFYWHQEQELGESEEREESPKRIYITRKNASRRRFVNEDVVQNTLESKGFVTLDFEDISFWEQISLMKNAEILVSVHGGALTNIHFLPSSAKVLELIREIEQPSDHHSLVYWHMCSALNIDYYYQFCKAEDAKSSFYEGDLEVNIMLLQENIERMESSLRYRT